jgi:peptidoglycan hydrolase-like protein with peptidoglycan-binding domain
MEGSTSDDVKNIQNQLNILSRAYLDIPLTVADGIYGQSTIGVVSAFQSIFDHPVTGIVDVVTWYKISCAYARLTNASSLCGPDENG